MKIFSYRNLCLTLLICCIFLASSKLPVHADEYSSSHYTVSGPVLFPGGYSQSHSFGITGVISQTVIGDSVSSTFKLFSGFLYYPYISTPALSATAGDGQVSLTWTNADASNGWAVSGYSVGYRSSPSGPYTYIPVGNALSYIQTNLTNSTNYYFIIRVADALGNFIATSTEISATPTSPQTTPPDNGGNNNGNSGGGGNGSSGGGGGGGGGGIISPSTGNAEISVSGRAYPGSLVTLLKDGQIAITTTADPNAEFQMALSGLTGGTYSISVYSTDSAGRRSDPITIPVTLTANSSATIGGLFLSPTIAVDKSQVKKGDTLSIFGQTTGSSVVTIAVHSAQPYFATTTSDKNGAYLYNFDTSFLEYGNHLTQSKSATSSAISPYSPEVDFTVGDTNVPILNQKKELIGDLNHDGRINLIDFSIMLFWFNKKNFPSYIDLNHDGKINLIDFSIMAYHWTG